MDADQEYLKFLNMGIDGYFTDFPGSLNSFFQGVNCPEIPQDKNDCWATRADLFVFLQALLLYFYLVWKLFVLWNF